MSRLVLVFTLALLALAGCSRDPEAAKQKYLRIGDKYFDDGDFKTASILYRRAIKVDPHYGEAYYRLGRAERRQGRIRPAAQAWRRATELMPDHEEPFARLAGLYLSMLRANPARRDRILPELNELFERARMHLSASYAWKRARGELALTMGDYAEAAARLAEAQAMNASDPGVGLSRVRALAMAGQFDEAEPLAWQAIEAAPAFGPMYDFLYQSYGQLHRLDEAQKVLEAKRRNNPDNIGFALQLATHYRATRQPERMEALLTEITAEASAKPAALAALGSFLFRIREYDRAMATLETGVAKWPDRASEFRRGIAQVLAAQGKNEEAQAIVRQLIAENPKDTQALSLRAALLTRDPAGDGAEAAITDLKAGVDGDPRNAALRYRLARAYARENLLAEALSQYKEVLRLRPGHFQAAYQIAVTQFNLEDYAAALTAASQLISRQPDFLPAHLLRVRARVKLGELAQARAELEALHGQQPSQPAIRRQLALVDVAAGRATEGLTGLRELLAENPNDRETLAALVRTHIAGGQPEQAAQLLRAKLDTAPCDAGYRQLLAQALIQMRDYSGALREMETVLASNPDSPGIHFQMGQAYQLAGEPGKAEASYRKAHELAPERPGPAHQICVVTEEQGRPDEAVQCFDKLVAADANNARALIWLARLLARDAGSLDRAQGLAERARQLLPNDWQAAEALASVYARNGSAAAALDILNGLAGRHPRNATIRAHRALALHNDGWPKRAREELQAALAIDPSIKAELRRDSAFAPLLQPGGE